jgi:hypothetical protein
MARKTKARVVSIAAARAARSPKKTAARAGRNQEIIEAPTTWQGEDDVFFHKSQIKVGTRLLNFGRKDHGSIWVVTHIYTHVILESGRIRRDTIEMVQKLNDYVEFRKVVRGVTSNEQRQRTFGSLSYTAVWRLA